MTDCFVYIIRVEGEDIVKVGVSSDPNGRLRQLLTGSPFSMKIEQVFRFDNRDIAMRMEYNFHKSKSAYRQRGEWFGMSPIYATCCMTWRIFDYLREMFGDDWGAIDDAFSSIVNMSFEEQEVLATYTTKLGAPQ